MSRLTLLIFLTIFSSSFADLLLNDASMRISEKKCRDYEKIVKTEHWVGSLMLGDPPRKIEIDNCKHKSIPLVVGGVDANLYEFPHQALLGYDYGRRIVWNCGGSLVSNQFVLTAAHCLYPPDYSPVKYIRLGMNSRSEIEGSNIQTFNVEEIFMHPNYRSTRHNEDIGLIKLDGVVTLNEFILPICLPTKLYDDYHAIASGFGKIDYDEGVSENLMRVTLEKFTQDECQETFRGTVRVTNDTMLCYGHHTERKDTCGGDSGGPLQIYNDKEVPCTYKVIGVVSFGLKMCGTAGTSAVYTNVFHYLDWIEKIVWG